MHAFGRNDQRDYFQGALKQILTMLIITGRIKLEFKLSGSSLLKAHYNQWPFQVPYTSGFYLEVGPSVSLPSFRILICLFGSKEKTVRLHLKLPPPQYTHGSLP